MRIYLLVGLATLSLLAACNPKQGATSSVAAEKDSKTPIENGGTQHRIDCLQLAIRQSLAEAMMSEGFRDLDLQLNHLYTERVKKIATDEAGESYAVQISSKGPATSETATFESRVKALDKGCTAIKTRRVSTAEGDQYFRPDKNYKQGEKFDDTQGIKSP